MAKNDPPTDRWRFTVGRDHIIISRAYAQSYEGVEETPRKHRRAGDMLVVGFEAGVFRTCTIIRIDSHVSTDALRRLTPFGRRKWELNVHLNRLTAWLVFDDVVKAAAAWQGIRAGGALPVIANSSKPRSVTLGPFEPRSTTSTMLQSGAFYAAREARQRDIAMLMATGIPVTREPMDDLTRRRLWEFINHFLTGPDAKTRDADALSRALDTLARESADPDTRERLRQLREELNHTRRNG